MSSASDRPVGAPRPLRAPPASARPVTDPTTWLQPIADRLPRLQPSLGDLRIQRTLLTASYGSEWMAAPVNAVSIAMVAWLYADGADWSLLGPLLLAWLVTTLVPVWHGALWARLQRARAPDDAASDDAVPRWLARYLVWDLAYAATIGAVALYAIAFRPDTALFVVIGVLMIHFALMVKDVCMHFAAAAQGLLLFGPIAVLFAMQPDAVQRAVAGLLVLNGVGTGVFARDLSRAVIEQMTQRFELQRLSADLERARDEAERANVAKSRFFASVSHDLRQPMHALTLLSHSLARDNRDPSLERLVRSLSQAADGAAQSVRQMLDISRIDAGLQAPTPVPVSLSPLLAEIALSFEPRFAEAGMSLRMRALRLRLSTDPVLVRRIVSNLLDNALAHSGGRSVLLGARRRGDRVRVAVWDDGRGIGPEHVGHVFDELYQVGNEQRSRERGLGLGLAIVRRLARQLGGDAGVRSRPGRGTMFWIDLPCTPVPADDDARVADAPAGPMPERVLVLDDDAVIRASVEACLAPLGVDVEAAADVAGALAIVAASPSRARSLVVDFRLGGAVDGIEAVARLRAEARVPMPALLVTGDSTGALVERAAAARLAVLTKPVAADTLIAALRAG